MTHEQKDGGAGLSSPPSATKASTPHYPLSTNHPTMPDVLIKNETNSILNIALSQLCPLHFKNAVKPGEAFKTRAGSVWFTVEWCIDHPPHKGGKGESKSKGNRFSAAQSARTIMLVSAAGLSVVALAGPVALSAAAAAGSATAASLLASSSVLAAAGTAEALAFSSYAGMCLQL